MLCTVLKHVFESQYSSAKINYIALFTFIYSLSDINASEIYNNYRLYYVQSNVCL